MSVEARVDSGAGLELLLGAASVADPRWRLVFTGASELAARWQRQVGRETLADVGRFGRLGWINLLGRAVTRGARSRDDVLDLVGETDPVALHGTLMGADRRSLAELLGPESRTVVLAAASGDPSARTTLRRSLTSGETSLEVHRWLWQTESETVRDRCLDVLRRLPESGAGPDPGPLRELVAAEGFEGALARVAPRLHYRPGSVGPEVALVASRTIEPVIVEIDLVGLTVIGHPPIPEPAHRDPAARLRLLARAIGDDVRLGLLEELRHSARTLPELTDALDRPRTTLLHHLALLRGAGLIDVEVPTRGPNSYRIDDAGLGELADALHDFVERPKPPL